MRSFTILALLFSVFCTAQIDDIIEGKVIKITSPLSFELRVNNNDNVSIGLADLESFSDEKTRKNLETFLKTHILNQRVYFSIENVDQKGVLMGILLYNCTKVSNGEGELFANPCINANNLNMDLLLGKLAKYTGSNKFMKQLIENNIPD